MRDCSAKRRIPTKLTDMQVLAIYHDAGKHRDIASKFGVSKTLVTQIKARQAWRHLTEGRLPLSIDPMFTEDGAIN